FGGDGVGWKRDVGGRGVGSAGRDDFFQRYDAVPTGNPEFTRCDKVAAISLRGGDVVGHNQAHLPNQTIGNFVLGGLVSADGGDQGFVFETHAVGHRRGRVGGDDKNI